MKHLVFEATTTLPEGWKPSPRELPPGLPDLAGAVAVRERAPEAQTTQEVDS